MQIRYALFAALAALAAGPAWKHRARRLREPVECALRGLPHSVARHRRHGDLEVRRGVLRVGSRYCVDVIDARLMFPEAAT